MHTDLDEEVRAALVARKGDWPRIAAEVDISHSWISQFVRNKIENPGYVTLKRLHVYLSKPAAAETAPTADTQAAA